MHGELVAGVVRRGLGVAGILKPVLPRAVVIES